MRKRLVLFFVLISSILCMIGCGNDPYEKMSLVSTNNGETVQLNILEENINGSSVYTYDSYTFDVQVKNIGDDVDPQIRVSGGQGMVDFTAVYKGNGLTTIKVTPLSPEKTGKFTLVVKTIEGNKSISIDFNIDLKLNNFFINQDRLKVVSKGQQIDLTDLDKYVAFDPVNTTQKDIKFEVVTPVDGVISGYADFTYIYNDLSGQQYAKVEDNVLKTYSGVEYPKKIESTIVGDQESWITTQCVTLKASYVGEGADEKKIPDRFIDVEVIENCADVKLLMNHQINRDTQNDSSSFALEKNDRGEYDVTLINPNYRYGVKYDTYYIERDLIFDFGVPDEENAYNPNDYFVETDAVLETSNKPIVLSYSSLDNSFKVQAQRAGTYRHVFKLDHVKYPGIIDTDIVVNFHVLDLPTDIKVNGSIIKDAYKVYDYYAASYGARFNIDLNNTEGEFNYFVYVLNEAIKDKLHLYKNDGTEQIIAVSKEEGGEQTIATENYSNFKDNETFYIRHSFETLPEEDVYIYVAVKYAAYSDSYSSDIKANYFITDYVSFPIKLNFENGLKTLSFTQKKYMVDVTNELLNNGIEDYDGIKLFDLPKGQSINSVIETNGIIYDHNLIHVYSKYDEFENVSSLYMKCNSNYQVGQTTITVKTRNGLVKSATVDLFVPTLYAQNLSLTDESYYMPIGMSFDTDIPLYYFTGKAENNPLEPFVIRKTIDGEQEIWGDNSTYMSLSKLIMIKGNSLDIKFYDYLLHYDENGMRQVTPIDITSKVRVTFNYDNYVTYRNGTITAKAITENISNPIIMTVTYVGGYMENDAESGQLVYKTIQESKNIEIYIYNALQGLKITSPTNVDMYVDDFLGYFDKDKSVTTIVSNFEPHRLDLGSDWNVDWKWGDLPVDLIYDVEDILHREIYDTEGKRLEIFSLDGTQSYVLKYSDLFETVGKVVDENYRCTLKCRVGSELLDWIRLKSGFEIGHAEQYMRDNIFNRNIKMVINVYAKQFSKLQIVSNVNINAKLAQKIGKFDIDVADDGVYFEIDRNHPTQMVQNIAYTIDNPQANNKNIVLLNATNSTYSAEVAYSVAGNGGVIKITAKGAGIIYLKAVPQDNIKEIGANGGYIYYDNSLVQEFRIKVADGSEEYPYEIKSVADYNRMQQNVIDNNYYYYILTKNINLNETNKNILSFNKDNVNTFSLNGAYSYIRNGIEYNVASRLYNLVIKQNIDAKTDIYLGLFGQLTHNVHISNLTLTNARIELKINNMNGKNLYVGLLAGSAVESKISNTQVVGSVKITNLANEDSASNINIGGLFGATHDVTISGLPVTYQSGITNTGYNANVSIDYAALTSPNHYADLLNSYKFNIGGLIGYDLKTSKIKNQNVVSTIKGFNYNSAVGGVVGLANNTKLESIVVYPKINITDSADDFDNVINIGGLIGAGDDQGSSGLTSINVINSKVYFVREDVDNWLDKAGIYVKSLSKANVGGFIGSTATNKFTAQYSYVRSFYNENISNDYLGNLHIDAVSSVGGLLGRTTGKDITIASCYFDGDIVALEGSNMGALIGSIVVGNTNITDSYGIAYLAQVSSNTLVFNAGFNNNAGMFGNLELEDTVDTLFGGLHVLLDPGALKSDSVDNLRMENVYSVINDSTYYFGEDNGDSVIGIYQNGENLAEIAHRIPFVGITENSIHLVFTMSGYRLVLDGANAEATSSDKWLWNKDVNIVNNIAFPILFNDNNTKAMYDLVPESISVERIDQELGFYDISYNDKAQILMFVNKNSNATKADCYEIAVSSETSSISIKFNGKTIITRYIELNSDIEITEDKGGTVISLRGSYIYPVNEGIATITIVSSLDKTVKLDIVIKVVAGITNVELLKSNDETNLYEKITSDNNYVYIDEVSTFKVVNSNIIDNEAYHTSNSYGYMVEIVRCVDESIPETKININGVDYTNKFPENEVKKVFINSSNIVIKGVNIGEVSFKITPCILINDLEIDYPYEYIELSNISSIYIIKSMARARSIDIKEDSLQIASKNSTKFSVVVETSNVVFLSSNQINILGKLNININSKTFRIDFDSLNPINISNVIDYVYDLDFRYELDYQLIRLAFNRLTCQKTDIDVSSSQYTYKLIFEVEVSFNANYYRENANSIDLNTIVYPFNFVPSSNDKVNEVINISISPAELTEIFTNYYSKGELLITGEEEYIDENESKFIVPGRSGLLKITLDEEFNDSSYIEIILKNEYKNFVTITQMAGNITEYIDEDLANNIEYLTENITSYNRLAFNEIIERDGEYGIRLSKLTLNYKDKDYFNKTYFVRVDLSRDYAGLQEIEFTIIPYKVTADGVEKITSYEETENGTIQKLPKIVTYSITQLPLLYVKVDDSYVANLGKGVMKELDITYAGVTNDIDFKITDTKSNSVYDIDDKVYIIDENGNKINGTFSIEYLNQGKKYYLCADVTTELTTLSIDFMVEEMVLGVREHAQSKLTINIVEFEIDCITIDRAVDGLITLKHGQQLIFTTNIDYKDIVVGDPVDIEAYKELLDEPITGKVSMIEYAISGTDLFEVNSTLLVDGSLRLAYQVFRNTEYKYEPMNVGSTYDYVTLIEGGLTERGYNFAYYMLKATAVTKDNAPVKLRLYVSYAYDNGVMVIGTELMHDTIEVDFEVIVEDSSTYDHPNPIETVEELIVAAKSNGGDYILLNNLTLKNWIPVDATFDSLDGNGYVITIESFDLSAFRGGDEANIGIFATTATNTLLKNITVDISRLLKSETQMINDVNRLKNSTMSTYRYGDNLDLAYTLSANIGVLVGVNNGAITNAKIINTKNTTNISSEEISTTPMYLHFITSQGFIEEQLVVSNIGGIVGLNSESGAITNSLVGLNISNMTGDISKVKMVTNPNPYRYNNSGDELVNVEVYPFILAGGNNLGGLVAENNGIISNAYAKGLGLYNTYPAVKDSKTAGLVAINNSVITSSFVESVSARNYRAVEDSFIIESTGNVGGLVFENYGTIENSYANVYLETQSAFTGGFVFQNNENAVINKSYTTSVNKNSLAHGQFTGIATNGRDVLNYGTYNNCYYLVAENEIENHAEYATSIKIDANKNVEKQGVWNGFSFAKSSNEDGIWKLKEGEGYTPRIATTLTDTYSFRVLTDTILVKETVSDGEGTKEIEYTIYNYSYEGSAFGSQMNPLIIDQAEYFDKYIIDLGYTVEINGKDEYVFGVNNSSNHLSALNTVSHVRLVNNLNFERITTAVKHNNKYLYEIIFAGVLDGNGMTLSNLNINTDTEQLDNFGLFAQIGIDSNIESKQTIVKNLNVNVRTYKSSASSRAGILAGTIMNANIINVKVNGGASESASVVIGGRNMSGALAGLIYADGDKGRVSLYDIIVENVVVESSYSSLGGELTDESEDKSGGFYKSFSVKTVESPTPIERSFTGLYDLNDNATKLYESDEIRKDVSYAGAVAGVILANNYATDIYTNKDHLGVTNLEAYNHYRTQPDSSTIDNVIVKNNITIRTADNAGGLFGYVGEKTLIKNSHFVLNGAQVIRANNYTGGLIAENHGVIEQCTVAFDNATQSKLDSKINQNDRESGDYILFDTAHDSKNYSVSIGGIAGYSSNGVIIDSYSKVNVIKPNVYIAGGILGYSEGYNYIAYTYSTGAVYGKFIIGGLVGLQLDTYDEGAVIDYSADTNRESLHMDYSIALTDWNYINKLYDYRQEITSKLYNNQKVLYENAGEYYNFYIKMPQVGNLNIISGWTNDGEGGSLGYFYDDTAENNLSAQYREKHDNYYVGSAIGIMITSQPTASAKYSLVESDFIDRDSIVDNHNHTKILNQSTLSDRGWRISSNYIITNVLGIYTEKGSSSSGSRDDTYFETKFNYKLGSNKSIDLYSFRIDNNINAGINVYDNVEVEATKPNDYFDRFNFDESFDTGWQEYTQQILGTYATSSQDEGETVAENRPTLNLFRYDYNQSQRFAFRQETESSWFANDRSKEVWQFNGMLPEFNDGTYLAQVEITNTAELNSALMSVGTGITYNVNPETANIIYCDIDDNKDIKYTGAIRDVFNGVIQSGEKPTLKFIIKDASKVNTLFSLLSGAEFKNIKFDIEYDTDIVSNKEYNVYGLFANALQNTTIIDCEINITFKDNITIGDIYGNPIEFHYYAKDAGVFFGSVSNSILQNNKFTLTANGININHTIIENFGVLAGTISNSTITGNKFDFNLNENDITLYNYNKSLNVGLIAGSAEYVTYSDNELTSYDFNIEDKSINEVSDTSTNIGLVFGLGYNSNIKNIEGFNASLTYIISGISNNHKNAQNVNLALLVAMSYVNSFDNININSSSYIKAENEAYRHETMNVGSIIGQDIGSSKIGNYESVTSSADIKVHTSAKNLSVGGLVGASNQSSNLIKNSFNNSNIDVKNIMEGTIVDNKVTEYINTSVGGLVGSASGVVRISDVYSAGNISTTLRVNHIAHKSGIGGIIGLATGNISLSNFVALNDFKINGGATADDKYYETYVSGVVGLNNGLFTGNNGYSYVELPNANGIITSAITNNSVSSTTENVFYAQEFVGNSYDASDYKFQSFAMADLHNEVNEYAAIYILSDYFDKVKVGSIELLIPKNLGYVNTSTSGTRFEPSSLDVLPAGGVVIGTLTAGYYVLLEDVKNLNQSFSIDTINAGAYLSGRTSENGKVIINVHKSGSASDKSYAVVTNKGVISNIYLETTDLTTNESGRNVSLVMNNEGIITNVYVYGYTEAQFSFAQTNKGKIYQSATATVYHYAGGNNQEDSWPEIYGFVKKNTETGIISDCYSSNFGITKKSEVMTKVYGLAYENDGIIRNSYHYTPELVEYDNKDYGYVCTGSNASGKISTGSLQNNAKGMMPKFNASRSSVWYIENDHAQIKGIKDIPGSIVIRVILVNSKNTSNKVSLDDAADLNDIKAKIRNKNTSYYSYYFDYELDFYVLEADMPKYTVVKIETGDELVEYIDSINGQLKDNTIVLIDGESIKIGQMFKTFSIASSAMFVGVGRDGATISYDNKNNIPYAMISYNYGVIAGITFDNFSFYNQNSNLEKFAPIIDNFGIIYDVTFNRLFVNCGQSKYVAGIVAINHSNAVINGCVIDNYTLHSTLYMNRICADNKVNGKIYNCRRGTGSGVSSGTSSSTGNDGQDTE